jgi:hypothetical protein
MPPGGGEPAEQASDGADARHRQVGRHAAWHDPVDHQAMPEAGLTRRQHVLALQGAMGVDGEHAGIVADRTDVADVMGHALQLGHYRPQQDGARRHRPAERRLDGAREGPGIGHRAVAGDAADQPSPSLEIGGGQQALDALVDVAEPLLQPHHRLAVGREAEMAGLDDAGMDRADRNLVQPFALDRQEFVARAARLFGPAAP